MFTLYERFKRLKAEVINYHQHTSFNGLNSSYKKTNKKNKNKKTIYEKGIFLLQI